jgi:hypothetical protein
LEQAHDGLPGACPALPTLGDALNAGYLYLEVNASAATPIRPWRLTSCAGERRRRIHELERYMRCRHCSELQGYPFKRSHLIALRTTKISASDRPSEDCG